MSFTVKFDSKLDDRVLQRMMKNLQKLNSVEVRFGWWAIARYPKRHRSGGAAIAQVAFWNEFGTFSKNGKRHIPPRPYLSQTATMLKHIIFSDIVKYFRDNIYGARYSKAALQPIPMKIHGVFEAVVGTGQALSQKTIAMKNHDEHWLETGRLLKNFQVKIIKSEK